MLSAGGRCASVPIVTTTTMTTMLSLHNNPNLSRPSHNHHSRSHQARKSGTRRRQCARRT